MVVSAAVKCVGLERAGLTVLPVGVIVKELVARVEASVATYHLKFRHPNIIRIYTAKFELIDPRTWSSYSLVGVFKDKSPKQLHLQALIWS